MSKKLNLFNPLTSKIEIILSKIKISLFSYRLPKSQGEFIQTSFNRLIDSIPMFDYSNNSKLSKKGFDNFWKNWIPFREDVLEHSSHSVLEFFHMFLTEKFDEIEDIIRILAENIPNKLSIKRDFEISKEKLIKSFLNLQQILLQQFNDEIDPSQQIRNLALQRSRIRRIKTDIINKFSILFESIERNDLMNQLINIFEDLLGSISDLFNQFESMKLLKNELIKAEEQLYEMYPPSQEIEIGPIEEIISDESEK